MQLFVIEAQYETFIIQIPGLNRRQAGSLVDSVFNKICDDTVYSNSFYSYAYCLVYINANFAILCS